MCCIFQLKDEDDAMCCVFQKEDDCVGVVFPLGR